ncbi:hypothetical protein [Pseudomonas phage pPA-3099-2aT.2]|uniref:Uncharacterized protein n=2 Tax=Skurskavirinae TaxID=3152223 RepID=A0AAE9HGM9_9CAUD|nr:hypothetical protein QE320_gp069 [Pseudomonas phage EM]YP_010762636.1 hypothetical protein QE325_gp131 [Pseudomonas phage pPA-3099-2aT.2]UPW35985.1 hypothetical protein EM_200 [Pseudomonas phage EM]WBQ35250.1 hypothetical protein [Pseudomonas phage pPA-3099-2aT.2]
MERAHRTGNLRNMCFRMAEAEDWGNITEAELNLFKRWIRRELEGDTWQGVTYFLSSKNPHVFDDEPPLCEERSNWCNFYVWAYYDLLKKKS